MLFWKDNNQTAVFRTLSFVILIQILNVIYMPGYCRRKPKKLKSKTDFCMVFGKSLLSTTVQLLTVFHFINSFSCRILYFNKSYNFFTKFNNYIFALSKTTILHVFQKLMIQQIFLQNSNQNRTEFLKVAFVVALVMNQSWSMACLQLWLTLIWFSPWKSFHVGLSENRSSTACEWDHCIALLASGTFCVQMETRHILLLCTFEALLFYSWFLMSFVDIDKQYSVRSCVDFVVSSSTS